MSDKKLASEVESMDPGPSRASTTSSMTTSSRASCGRRAKRGGAAGLGSPSQKPLKGIPLPPAMPPLPEAGGGAGGGSPSRRGGRRRRRRRWSSRRSALDSIEDLGDDDIADISKFHSGPMTKEQKLTQRMQRKAESARIARLRKKYVGGLEEQVSKLQAEVARLREMQRAAPAAPAASLVGASPPSRRARSSSRRWTLTQAPRLGQPGARVNASVEKYVAPHFCAIPAQFLRDSLTPAQLLRLRAIL